MNHVACPRCGMELLERCFESSDFNPCHICGAQILVTGFPACMEMPSPAQFAVSGERADEEAACFHHELRKAAHVCSQCGKFLCTLCASNVGNDILCPACLVAGVKGATGSRLEQERTLYDSIALALGILPAFTVSLAGIGGAVAIYVALRYWKRPGSLVRPHAWRRYLAIVFGLSEIALTVFLIASVIAQRAR